MYGATVSASTREPLTQETNQERRSFLPAQARCAHSAERNPPEQAEPPYTEGDLRPNGQLESYNRRD